MTIVWKLIKPSRLNVAAIWYEIQAEIEKAGKDITKDFEKTTKTWNTKPKFETVTDDNPPSVLVGTDDKIYGYVSGGTKPHIIRPVNARVLRFKPMYKAKTSPNVIGSSAGGASGNDVLSMIVHHPGTQAREFEKTIQQKWKATFKKRMELALARGIKKSGHYISK